jgi:hypothetical protein
MSIYGFYCVSGTRWVIPTITAQKRTNTINIELYRPCQDFTHFAILSQCVSIEIFNSSLFFWRIFFCANTTISMPDSSFRCRRKLSLITLFIKLRCTASRKFFFDIASPSRATLKEFSRASTKKLLSAERCAESKTFLYSDASVSLNDFGNASVR